MKRTLPFIAVLMFAASSFAQGPRGVFPIQCDFLGVDKYTVLDEAEYKFSYKLTCVIDTVGKKSIVNTQQSIRQVMNDHRAEMEQKRMENKRLIFNM
jgi:hypothetical protein